MANSPEQTDPLDYVKSRMAHEESGQQLETIIAAMERVVPEARTLANFLLSSNFAEEAGPVTMFHSVTDDDIADEVIVTAEAVLGSQEKIKPLRTHLLGLDCLVLRCGDEYDGVFMGREVGFHLGGSSIIPIYFVKDDGLDIFETPHYFDSDKEDPFTDDQKKELYAMVEVWRKFQRNKLAKMD